MRQRLTSTCLFVLYLFPFDMQHCNITFTTMTSGVNSISLGTCSSEELLTRSSESHMVTRGEWQLETINITHVAGNWTTGLRERLVYTITISRKPMLYVIIFIVPLFYFVLLDVASFFINEARGEKLSFKVTVLLSISVLLLILKDLLPSTEDGLPMIAIYCCVIFVLVGLSLLEAMLVSFLIDLDSFCKNPEAPEGEAVQLEADRPDATELHGAGGTPEKSSPPLSRPGDLLELILQEVKKVGQEARGRDKGEKRPGRYRRLAEIIDCVFFFIYLLCICSFLMYMLLRWVSQIW